MPRARVVGIAGLVSLLAGAVLAQAPVATTVIDGDTIRYGTTVMHLWGIDAPEKDQVCGDTWPAGRMAAEYLIGLIHNRAVVCDYRPWPATPRQTYGVCKVDGQDLGAAMVAAGMAWSNTDQTRDYTVQESQAMSNVLGVHGNACLRAWEWRAQRRGAKP